MSSMTHRSIASDRIRPAKRRDAGRDRGATRRRLLVEILEGRALLTVAFDPATGIFTGDATAQTLLLSESAGKLQYTVDPDGLNGPAVTTTTTYAISSASTITVNLGAAGNTLRLDPSWTFTEPVTFTGGAGTDTLDDKTASTDTWTLTGANAGNINSKVTFTSVENAIGGAAGTLTGAAGDSTWTFGTTTAPTQTYALTIAPTTTLTFQGFGTLQGGAGVDTFNLIGDGVLNVVNANLNGGAGNDVFAFSNGTQLVGNINGQTGNNTLDYSNFTFGAAVSLTGPDANGYTGSEAASFASPGGFSGIDIVKGANLGDQLNGLGVASTWSLGATTSTYRDTAALDPVLTFSGFNDLAGGSAADIFDLSSYTTGETATLTGASATGFAGGTSTALGTGGIFSGMDSVIGLAGDTLIGESVASTWALGTSQTYGDGTYTLPISGFGTLQGGSLADTFNVTANTAANLHGGAGTNNFVFNNGIILTGAVAGGAGTDTLNLVADTSAVLATLASSDATGFTGTVGGITSGFSSIDVLTAGTGTGNTLTGENAISTWALGASQTVTVATDVLTFSNFGTLQGGSAADTFAVTVGSAVAIQGGGGVDTLDLSGYAIGQNVTLTGYDTTVSAIGFAGGTGSVTGAFTGINVLTGKAGDTLTGDSSNSTWNVSATPTYLETGGSDNVAFSGFDTLQGGAGANIFNIQATTSASLLGGAGNDSFVFSDAMASTGTINGGGGTNTLDYSAYLTPVTVNVGANTATGTSVLVNIEAMTGSTTASSTLISANATNNWSITGNNAGSISGPKPFAFTQVGNLTGGILNDVFTFASGATETGAVVGGSGTNTLNMAADTAGVTANITANNSVTIAGVTFTGIANLVGGSGANTFAFSNGKTISGTINGGSGTNNTLDYSAYSTGVRVNLTQSAAAGIDGGAVNGISNIQNVTGGAGNDILIGNAANNVLHGNGGNNVMTGGGGSDTLIGGSGRDILIGGLGADTITAGTGEDIIVGDATTYDTNATALAALMAEWGRTDVNYTTRVGHINGTIATGGRNGSYKLTATTVITDTAVDILTSGAGLEWYIAPTSDNAAIPTLKTINGVTEIRTTL